MDENKNIILSDDFFNTKLFVVNDNKNTLINGIGSNQKHLLIVYKSVSDSSKELDFLGKILSAVKYDLKEDVLLVNVTANDEVGFNTLRDNHQIKDVIVFGMTPKELGLHFHFSPYQPLLCGGCRFLFAHSLSEIASNKEWKGGLWNALQDLFLNN